jgi:hypothetical protein
LDDWTKQGRVRHSLALDPQFSFARWSDTVGVAPGIVDELLRVLHAAGLSE